MVLIMLRLSSFSQSACQFGFPISELLSLMTISVPAIRIVGMVLWFNCKYNVRQRNVSRDILRGIPGP
jgi:hypothetical protein